MQYQQDIYDIVRLIPKGKVTTYGRIASFLALGSARMVGWAMNKSYLSDPQIPAHRVVNRKGIDRKITFLNANSNAGIARK